MVETEVRLSNCETPDEGHWIPSNCSYDRLVKAAYGLYDHFSKEEFDVHFHKAKADFGRGNCDMQLSSAFWDDFLTRGMATTGKICIYAHFTPMAGRSALPVMANNRFLRQSSAATSVDPLITAHERTRPRAISPSEPTAGKRRGRPPKNANRVHPFRPTARDPGHLQERRSQTVDTNMSDGEMRDQREASEQGLGRTRTRWPFRQVPFYDPEVDPPGALAGLDPNEYIRELKAAESGDPGDEVSTERMKRNMGAAKMIRKYGIIAQKPCTSCEEQGIDCHVKHPILYTEQWYAVNKFWNKVGRCAHCVEKNLPGCSAR